MEKIAVGSTRAGLTLKEALIKYLESKGFATEDVGMKRGGEFVPYHKSAMSVAREVSEGRVMRGIAICGTGAGSVIAAAKFAGVYPVHATDEFTAQKAKEVNNCNVLVFGEWLTPPEHAFRMVDRWLEAEFTGGVDDDWKAFLSGCVDEIAAYEKEHISPDTL